MWNPENKIRGTYRLKSGVQIGFTAQGGELLFSESGMHATLDTMKLKEKDELNLIARALYSQAQNGYDPDSGVKSAAAHVVLDKNTGERRVFIASNANSRSRQQRPHAEVNALVIAKNAIEGQHFTVEKTYLTLFNPKGNNLYPATPCGHCREDLTDKKFVALDAELYCLPSLNPDKLPDKIPVITISDHPDIQEAKGNTAFKMKMMYLARKALPIPATAEEIDDWKQEMEKGIEYATNPEIPFNPIPIDIATRDQMLEQIAQGNSGRLLHLEGSHQTLANINQQLTNMIKSACHQHPDTLADLHKVRAAIAVRENGDVYGGTYVDLKTHSAKPQAEVMALGNALNTKDIKAIYIMEMDQKYIQKSLDSNEPPTLKMPYPEALDGIMKSSHSPQGEQSPSPNNVVAGSQHSRCMIHTIALNDGSVPEAQLKTGMVSVPIEKLLIAPFQAPTMHQGRAFTEPVKAPVTGCC